MRRVPIALSILALASAALLSPARADPPPDRTVRYQVRRNGDSIGTHRVVFARQGVRHRITHEIRIRVTVLRLEAYRWEMNSQEVWEGDRLLGLSASTDRNGDPLTVFARLAGTTIRVRGPAGQRSVPPDAVPSAPQHDVFARPRPWMIEAEDGRVIRVRVSAAESVRIRVGGTEVPCRRYRVSGGLEATLTYAEDTGILVHKVQTAPDGSQIFTVMQ
jgi:uncharacterized protein DUF6134